VHRDTNQGQTRDDLPAKRRMQSRVRHGQVRGSRGELNLGGRITGDVINTESVHNAASAVAPLRTL
jgi:hypothetical protein